jgi:hypothetical protein
MIQLINLLALQEPTRERAANSAGGIENADQHITDGASCVRLAIFHDLHERIWPHPLVF